MAPYDVLIAGGGTLACGLHTRSRSEVSDASQSASEVGLEEVLPAALQG